MNLSLSLSLSFSLLNSDFKLPAPIAAPLILFKVSPAIRNGPSRIREERKKI